MRAIGIRDLKARLSEYVRLAKSGETILVTDHDEVVAELGPARRAQTVPGSLEDILQRLAEDGKITRARLAKEKGWTWKAAGLGLPEGTAEEILDEMREERF
jgi:prevent-host-death family protein